MERFLPDEVKTDNRRKAEGYCLLTQERLKSQERSNAEHGMKAFWVFSLAVAILAAGALLLTQLEFPMEGYDSHIVYALFAIMVVSLIVVGLQSIRAMGYNRWDKGPAIDIVRGHMSQPRASVMFKLVGDAFAKSIETNERHLETKGDYVHRAMFALLIEASTLMVLGAFIVSVIV